MMIFCHINQVNRNAENFPIQNFFLLCFALASLVMRRTRALCRSAQRVFAPLALPWALSPLPPRSRGGFVFFTFALFTRSVCFGSLLRPRVSVDVARLRSGNSRALLRALAPLDRCALLRTLSALLAPITKPSHSPQTKHFVKAFTGQLPPPSFMRERRSGLFAKQKAPR